MNKNKNTDTNSNNNEPPENIVKEGQSLIDEKKFTEALSFINNHLTDYPKSITFNNFLGLLALSDNNFDDAKVYFDKAFEYGSDIKVYNNNLSIIYSTIGSNFFANEDYKSALNNFLLAIKQGPLNPLINYFNVHKCYRKMNDFAAAEMVLKDALKNYPNSFAIYYHLHEMEIEQSNYHKALEYIRQSYEISNSYDDSVTKLPILIKFSKLLRSFGFITESIRIYVKAFLLDPRSKLIAIEITFLYIDLQDYKNAFKYIKLAHSIDSNNDLINTLKAFIDYKLNGNDALDSLSSIALNNSNFNLPHKYKGDIYFNNKDYKNAYLSYKECGEENYYQCLQCLLLDKDNNNLEKHFNDKVGIDHKKSSINQISASRLNIDYSNKFLMNPLEFIHKKDEITLLTDEYINNLLDEINNIFDKKDYILNSEINSLDNCSQTLGNFFLLENNYINELKVLIKDLVDEFMNSFKKSNEIFFDKWKEDYKIIGKVLKLNKGSVINPIHQDKGWITGIINLNSDNKINLNLSESMLYNNSDDLDQKSYSLNKGDIIIFPSSLCYRKASSSHEDNILIIFYAIPRPDNDKIYV